MKNALIVFLALCTFSSYAATKTLVYKAVGGKIPEFFQTFVIESLPDQGYKVTLTFTLKGALDRQHVIMMDSNFGTTKWSFHSPKNNLKIEAYRQGGDIFLTGLKNGKKTEKKFSVGNKLWSELFPTGLELFSLSSEKAKTFVSIGIEDKAEMQIGEFVAKKKGPEKLRYNNGEEEANLLEITFNDWKSMFWTGKSWHRKSDGRLLAIHVGRDIGTWELISEK